MSKFLQMKIFKYILFLLLIAVIGIAIYIAVQPNSYEVTRSRMIKAPSAVIYNNVVDLKNWEGWSPWLEKEPNTVISLGKETKGVNGTYSWTDKDGDGTMVITEATPNTHIKQNMQFGDFPPSEISWDFEPNDDGSTHVTWKISGKNLPFGFKAYTAFSGDMESQIAPDFERGLEKLDSLIVTSMKKYHIEINGLTQHGGGFYLYSTTSCKISELASHVQEMMTKVKMFAKNNNMKMAGSPFIYYHKWDEANNAVIFSSCIPTTEKVITTDTDIITGQIEPFKAVKTTLTGDYNNLKEAWDKVMRYIPENGFEFEENGPILEVYVTEAMKVPNPADWITEIYIAVK